MSKEIERQIREAAQARGIDPGLAVSIARAESGLNPNAKAKTSSAGGLFQVVDDTWKEFGGKPGKKFDVAENIRVGLDSLAKRQEFLKSALGRDPRGAELYAAHHFGPAGAKRLLEAQEQVPVAQVLSGSAVKSNPYLKGMTVDQLMAKLGEKVGEPRTVAAKEPPSAPVSAQPPARAAGAPYAQADVSRETQVPEKQTPPKMAELDRLGPGYQAALALAFLADEEEKEGRELDEPGIAAQWLAQEKRKPVDVTAGLTITSPFEQAPVMMADGGAVEADPWPDVKTMKGLDPLTKEEVVKQIGSVEAGRMKQVPITAKDPVTLNTIPEARSYEVPALSQSSTKGFTVRDLTTPKGSLVSDAVFLAPQRSTDLPGYVKAHEAEHLLAKRGLGDAYNINEKFDELTGSPGQRERFVLSAAKLGPYLEQKYGVKSGYFSPKMVERQGENASALFFEQAAVLAGIEQATGQDLTKDPELRKTIFKDPKVREAYNAVTGLRQTRLDARDISPYTRIPEKSESRGMLERLKSAIGMAEGGDVSEKAAEPTPEELELASKPAFRYPSSGAGRKISTKPGENEAAFVQGIGETPYIWAGAPVDIAAMALQPFGYSVQRPIGGSEWIKEKMTALGVRPEPPTQPTQRAFYELGQLGGSSINPAAPVRGAVKAAEKSGEAAKMLARDFQQYNREIAVPGASYAVDPGSNKEWANISDQLRQEVRESKPLSIQKEALMQFVKPVKQVSDNLQWVKLEDPRALMLEGGVMDHSINRYAKQGVYGHGGLDAFLSGRAEVFSLRDPESGLPMVTMEVMKYNNGDRRITQIKGPANSDPSAFRKQIFEFMDDPKMKVILADSEHYRKTTTGQEVPGGFNIYWQSDFDDWKLGILDHRRKDSE